MRGARALIACVALLASTLTATASAAPNAKLSPHAPDVVLVAYDRGTPAATRASSRATVGALHAAPLSPLATDVERLTLPPGADLARAIATLERQPNVRYAELDAVVEPLDASNDPYYLSDTNGRNLWGMYGDVVTKPERVRASRPRRPGPRTTGSRTVYVGIRDDQACGCAPGPGGERLDEPVRSRERPRRRRQRLRRRRPRLGLLQETDTGRLRPPAGATTTARTWPGPSVLEAATGLAWRA